MLRAIGATREPGAYCRINGIKMFYPRGTQRERERGKVQSSRSFVEVPSSRPVDKEVKRDISKKQPRWRSPTNRIRPLRVTSGAYVKSKNQDGHLLRPRKKHKTITRQAYFEINNILFTVNVAKTGRSKKVLTGVYFRIASTRICYCRKIRKYEKSPAVTLRNVCNATSPKIATSPKMEVKF